MELKMFIVQPKLLLLAAVSLGTHAQSNDLAISGARIEIGDGKVIASGTVVIHDGKIAAVGENVTAPPGAEIVDGKGLIVYPGFIDAYTTGGLTLPSAPSGDRAPDSRTTAPPSMWHGNRKGVRSDILCYKAVDLRTTARDANRVGVTTALLSPGSGPVCGISTIIDYTTAPGGPPASAGAKPATAAGTVILPEAAAELSFRNGAGGGGFGGGGGGSYPGTLFGVVALLRQTLADAQFYAAQPTPAKKDPAMENLGPVLTGKMPALFFADSAREIVRATRVSDEFSLHMILLGGREAYRDLDLVKAKGFPVIASLDLGFEPSLKPDSSTPASDGSPQAVLQERHDQWVEHSHNVKALYDAGIPLAFSSLGLSGGVDDFLKGLRAVIATGVPEAAVLKSVTSQSASILGIADKVGTIEPGKLANLVLFSGDFADPKSQVKTVFVEGVRVEMKKEGSK